MKNDNYHLGQLNRPVSQIDIQRNMVGFVVEGHNCWGHCKLSWMYITSIDQVHIIIILTTGDLGLIRLIKTACMIMHVWNYRHYAPIKVMPHLPPTGDRKGLD